MIKRTTLFTTVCALTTSHAFGILQGEITLLGYGADSPDQVAFVTWVDIPAFEPLYLTDAGFFDDGTLRDGEGIFSWAAPAEGVDAGTVITITGATTNFGNTAGIKSFGGGGDQIFIGTEPFPDTGDTVKPGSIYTGTLLFGFDYTGSAGFDADATDGSTSALPASLNAVGLNFSVDHADNGQYVGPRTGLTAEAYTTAILNASNWSFSNGAITFDDTTFSLVPEPSLYASLGGLIALGGVLLKRRKR